MRSFLSRAFLIRASSDPGKAGSLFWLIMAGPQPGAGGGAICRGELSALLAPGFALLGSELDGVGCKSDDRLALFTMTAPRKFPSECADRGGEMDSARCGGVPDGPVAAAMDGSTGPCGFLALTAIRLESDGERGCCVSTERPPRTVRGTDMCGEVASGAGWGLNGARFGGEPRAWWGEPSGGRGTRSYAGAPGPAKA